MDTKTKVQTVISLVLVVLITALAYWAQIPSKDLKAQLITEEVDTVLVRIQDFAFDPDIVRIEQGTAVSWVHDESEANADVQHTVTSYNPEDASEAGEEFESDLLNLGDTFTHQFEEPGVYNYNCSLYPFMTGKVCVGDESEELDEDCAIDLTEVSTAAADEEETAEEEPTEDDEEIAVEEDVLEEEIEETVTEAEVTEEDDEDILFEAADEDLDFEDELVDDGQATVFFESDSAQAGTVMASDSAETDGEKGELTDSGPEDLIYLIPLLLSFVVARKLTANAKA
jgi:plastocyanin